MLEELQNYEKKITSLEFSRKKKGAKRKVFELEKKKTNWKTQCKLRISNT